MGTLKWRGLALVVGVATLAGFAVLIWATATSALPLAFIGLALILSAVALASLATLFSIRRLIRVQDAALRAKELANLKSAVASVQRTLGVAPSSLEARLRHHVIRDTSALLTLHDLYPTPGEHVPLTSWSALPATALMLTEHVRELPAGSTVLELGSGATTVWMALASRKRGGDVRIVSLEASADFADVTRTAVRRNGVDDLVDLRVAALDAVATKHGEQRWYEAPSWSDLTGIALLFVDGPPGGTGPHARYPAVELLADRLAPGAIVVIDDADRDDEKAMLDDWLALDRDGRHPEIIEVRENATALRMP